MLLMKHTQPSIEWGAGKTSVSAGGGSRDKPAWLGYACFLWDPPPRPLPTQPHCECVYYNKDKNLLYFCVFCTSSWTIKNQFATEECFVVSVWVRQKGQDGQIFVLHVRNWLQLRPFSISCGRLKSLISSEEGANHSARPQISEYQSQFGEIRS